MISIKIKTSKFTRQTTNIYYWLRVLISDNVTVTDS